ncbi:MAG: aminoglycoside phosphotransferase family protein [Verrucomicrobiae bacterium]|nr:aminoglycoside phosphotransferase family protein [Verrucomicrobiae bacterium]
MSRRDIYYWKCDRPAAFHGTGPPPRGDEVPEDVVRRVLFDSFHPEKLSLFPASGQGNHLTWNAEIDGVSVFLRIENGPEKDNHLEMESAVLEEVARVGVPVPRVLCCDASRKKVPFAWQALERIPHPDLNHWAKMGMLDTERTAFEIGRNVSLWQSICPKGFGPFDLGKWQRGEGLTGHHRSYPDYFFLRLATHLEFLVANSFLGSEQADEIDSLIKAHAELLELDRGVLVHKDLALWNVLGEPDSAKSFIDFDDSISGDPMDDLSLLACFHGGSFLEHVFSGYTSRRALPEEWRRRFWMHLLRNMIVKAVIRVGAGYFERDSGFFLIGRGASGSDLRTFTEERIRVAQRGLEADAGIELLD